MDGSALSLGPIPISQNGGRTAAAGGTAYITDAGMCGVFDSALGLAPEPAIRRFPDRGCPTRFESVKGPVRLSGVLLEVDGKTGKAVSIKRVNVDG